MFFVFRFLAFVFGIATSRFLSLSHWIFFHHAITIVLARQNAANLCKYILNCQPNHFLTGASSNLFPPRTLFKIFSFARQRTVFHFLIMRVFSSENVCLLWKFCDILRKTLWNIALRAFWLLGKYKMKIYIKIWIKYGILRQKLSNCCEHLSRSHWKMLWKV